MPTIHPDRHSLWVASRKPAAPPLLQIFFLPHAGGGASVFRDWPALFPSEIHVCATELPGRGRRLREPLYRDLKALACSAAEFVLYSVQRPFALFGHSMGALIGFEMARLLAKHGKAPIHLFVAGARAPHFQPVDKGTFALPDKELLAELREINGTPPGLLDDPELMDLLLPVIRADFEMVQTYSYTPGDRLPCPITAFGGLQDEGIHPDQIQAWREHTVREFTISMVPGDHFFINSASREISQQMLKRLSSFRTSINA